MTKLLVEKNKKNFAMIIKKRLMHWKRTSGAFNNYKNCLTIVSKVLIKYINKCKYFK